MSNTFNSIYEQADENYRLQFAKMVREYFDANVLPPPLNILELCLNRCMRRKMAASWLLTCLSLCIMVAICKKARIQRVAAKEIPDTSHTNIFANDSWELAA